MAWFTSPGSQAGNEHAGGGQSLPHCHCQLATVLPSVPLAQVVSVLMRSPLHRHNARSDLVWLVLPAWSADAGMQRSFPQHTE